VNPDVVASGGASDVKRRFDWWAFFVKATAMKGDTVNKSLVKIDRIHLRGVGETMEGVREPVFFILQELNDLCHHLRIENAPRPEDHKPPLLIEGNAERTLHFFILANHILTPACSNWLIGRGLLQELALRGSGEAW
jgi:hypothetical protein